MTDNIAIAIADESLRQQVLAALEQLSIKVPENRCLATNVPDLLSAISQIRPSILVLGMAGLSSDPAMLLARVASHDPAPLILAVNDAADPELILKAMRGGAREFVYPPFESAFAEAIERLRSECAREAATARGAGRVIGVVSAKGGCGATTVACHAAAWLRQATRKEVLFVDLDWSSGIASMIMQITPRYSVSDAVSNLHRMDLTLWKAMVSIAPSGVHVIPSPPMPAGRAGAYASTRISELFRFWRTQYDFIVVDFGHGMPQTLLDVLDSLDTLVLTTTADLPSLRQATQIIQALASRNVGENRLKLVINRMPRRSDIDVPTLQRVMSFPVHATVPNDYRAVSEAYSEPRLLSFESPPGAEISALASDLAGLPAAAKKSRKFSLFG